MDDKVEPGGSPGDSASPEGALGKEVMSESQGKGTKASGELADYDGTYTPPAEGEQAGESSGNNASNGTTQRMGKSEAGEASTPAKPQGDDILELCKKGYCAHPSYHTGRPAQAGVGASGLDQLQTTWCRYAGQQVQRGAVWSAGMSPAVQTRLAHQQALTQPSVETWRASPESARDTSHQPSMYPSSELPLGTKGERQGSDDPSTPVGMRRNLSFKPPTSLLPALPTSPFDFDPSAAQRGAKAEPDAGVQGVGNPFPAKPQWPDSPRQSCSDDQHAGLQDRGNPLGGQGMVRQVSLPDINELAELWGDLPDEFSLDLDPLRDGPMGSLLPGLTGQMSLGLMRQGSLARLERMNESFQHAHPPSRLQSLRKNLSRKLTTANTWQPGQIDAQPLRRPGSMRMPSMPFGGPFQEPFYQADRSSSSEFMAERGVAIQSLNLPEHVEIALVGAPSVFSVPTCINKGFKPGFTVRVTAASSRPMRMPTTITAYPLQKEQVAKLDEWHPSLHVFAESLSGSVESATIITDGPGTGAASRSYPGKHVGTADITFNGLKFNTSSRMKPRWLLFALTMPTDDVIYVQYTVPTIVMSRQCDQTPRALAILRGEPPTRKRARQYDTGEPPRPSKQAAAFPRDPAGPTRPPAYLSGPPTPGVSTGPQGPQPRGGLQLPGGVPGPYLPIDQGRGLGFYDSEGLWPRQGPYVMPLWRDAIQKVCRTMGLTRSFEQEDMHELAKLAGFVGTMQTGGIGASVLSEFQWNRFGKWFLGVLSVLNLHKELWMSPDIVYICGFAANREWADQLLSHQPPGTFLLRPSMAMEATLVISVNTPREGQVIHLAIDSRQLAERSLEDWILDLPDTIALLDINTGRLYPKAQLFKRSPPPQTPARFPGGFPPPRMSPIGSPLSAAGGMQKPQGADALAHILEASRRAPEPFPPPGFGLASSSKLGPMGGPFDAQNPQMYNRWGTPSPRDSYPPTSLDTLTVPPPMFNGMRYQR